MINNAFCAICTQNYVPYAKVLANSLKSSGNNEDLYVLIIDCSRSNNSFLKIPNAKIVYLEDLNVPNLQQLIEKYSAFELCNVLKPYYLEWLLNKYPSINYLIYLDTDIYVKNKFLDVYKYFENNKNVSVLLLPNITPKSIVGKETDYSAETLFFKAGLYCGGFYAIRNDSNSKIFLKWQQSKISKFGYNAPNLHMFVDQKILDFSPLLFPFVSIYKNIGYNLGHWNYYENQFSKLNNTYYVGDTPLVFIHFSFLKFDKTNKENCTLFGIKLNNEPFLYEISSDYHDKLESSEDYKKLIKLPYGYQSKYKKPHLSLTDPLGNLSEELNIVKEDNLKLKNSLDDSRTLLLLKETEIKTLKVDLNKILNSRSWKIISKVRNIYHKVKLFYKTK